MAGRLGIRAALTVGLVAVALTLGAALSAAAAWIGWLQPPPLPTDAEAASLAARLVPGSADVLTTRRRDVVFAYGDVPRADRTRQLLLGDDDYDAGFVTVVSAAPDAAATLTQAEAVLRADRWRVRPRTSSPGSRSGVGASGVSADLGSDHIELYPSDGAGLESGGGSSTAVALVIRRAEPQWVPYASLGGWGLGLLLGASLFLRGAGRRPRRTLEALIGLGVLALLPGTVLSSAFVLLYLTGRGLAFPDAQWGGYLFWLVKPASVLGGVLLALAALLALVSRRRADVVPAVTSEAEIVHDITTVPAEIGEPEPETDAAQADLFVRHPHPVWRERADFVINAALPVRGEQPNRFEQLWARQVADEEFELCCIPFHLDGFALGDVVRTVPAGGLQYVVERVLVPSGRYVFRVFFSDPLQPHDETVLELAELGALLEHPSEDVLVVDARDDAHARLVESYLRAAQALGHLGLEIGRDRSAQPG